MEVLILFAVLGVLLYAVRKLRPGRTYMETRSAPPVSTALKPTVPPVVVDAKVSASGDSINTNRSASQRPAVSPSGRAAWHPMSSTVNVRGYGIDGMVYVGAGLRALTGSGAEPALIDPSLRVGEPSASYNGEDLTYWPSYSEISPQARGRYLGWLAGGRNDPRVSIGFVFLFFYGLERRLLMDNCPPEEREQLLTEIERLKGIYAENYSFQNYSAGLLDIVRARHLEGIREDVVPPVRSTWDQPYSAMLRIGLGHCAASGTPVPSSWALAWAESHPDYRQRTPAQRCRREFEQLFRFRYASRFPGGCVLKPNKRLVSLEYQPASASFGGPVTLQAKLPDVSALNEPGTTLKNLAMDCIDQLDPYSRYLGRNPGAGDSAAALAILPTVLLESHASPTTVNLRSWIDATLQDGFALVECEALVERCPGISAGGTLTKKDSIVLAQLLEKLNVGMEPDPRFGTAVPSPKGKIVLFPLGADRPTAPSQGYSVASMLVSLAATVAAADQKVTLAEEERLEQHIANTLDLSLGEDLRLRAQVRWLLETGVNLNTTKKRVEVLPVTKREAIGRFLVDVASADGEISPPEIDTLMKIYRMLGLDPKGIFAAAHAAATEPVTVRPPDQSPGTYAIPKPKPTAPPRVGPRIDMHKVASMHAESERVAALLREIFVEDETPRPPQIATGVLLLGLDGAQSAFLTRILAQPSWSRTDLESVAAECEVMIEGTLDAINDASLSRYDDFLLEGDDPLELNEAVAKELKREYCEAARA